MLDFSAVEVLSFDCYGTLIDWERGLLTALRAPLAARDLALADEALLADFAELEAAAEAGPYQRYRHVLAAVLTELGRRHGFAPSTTELEAFADSVGDWPAFPDTPAALAALQRRYRLAIISNVDDDLFARTNQRLGVAFDWVITAEQVGAYKPSTRPFEVARERIGGDPGRHVHVAQSLYHDHGPARRFGLATVWVDRRAGREGGATLAAVAEYDLRVPDMAALVHAAGLA